MKSPEVRQPEPDSSASSLSVEVDLLYTNNSSEEIDSMSKQAIVYGWRNVQDQKVYIGYHKTQEVHDGYVFSSENSELKKAWSYGLLQRHIIHQGLTAECITLENFGLKYAKANYDWSNFYNQSVGGGEGCVKDFSNLPSKAKQAMLNFLEGVNPAPPKLDTYHVSDRKLIDRLASMVRNGVYEKQACSVGEIYKLERNQVRLNIIHPDKVKQIADRMLDNPAEARKNVEPVIVCVYEDGTRKVIDGNHTINAAKQAGWVEVDVVFINFSDFGFNHANVNGFGLEMNHNPKLKTPSSTEDCQRAITNIYFELVAQGLDVDLKSEKFRNTVLEELEGWWTKQQIAGNIKAAAVKIRTQEEQALRNFKKWSDSELDKIAREIKREKPNLSVITISSGACYNAGVGAILNKMGGEDLTSGLIVVSHNDIGQYDRWKSSEKKLKKIISMLKGSGLVIRYIVLDAFA
jgi:hypothetical protein